MTVSILGCGWYGLELAKGLVNKWVKVKGSTTTADKLPMLAESGIEPYLIDLSPDSEVTDPDFFECDVLWISIPPKARTGNGAEYLHKIERLLTLIKTYQIKQVLLISSTGVYGDSNTEVTELDAPNPDSESGKVLLAAEDLLKQQTDFTTTIIRFGGLIGPGRDPGRFFAGKTDVPNGEAPVNLIHLTDCIGISNAILDKQAFGNTYNAVSPSHPTRANFYTQAAVASGLQPPHFIEEKENWKIVTGVNVGEVLGYEYRVMV
ncbi:SDR family oxidoreductase [Mucilaginibacter sp. UYCu711]|uniref:SDR family oxidoreductase n=1 Tax=Mucilaginibacter sp. UYCu711 TaxID=3156339 RepID=UPI003D19A89F